MPNNLLPVQLTRCPTGARISPSSFVLSREGHSHLMPKSCHLRFSQYDLVSTTYLFLTVPPTIFQLGRTAGFLGRPRYVPPVTVISPFSR